MGPILPAVFLWYDGDIIFIVEFPFFFLSAVDLEEEHPDNLLYALGIAVDTRILPHDVLQPLDEAS